MYSYHVCLFVGSKGYSWSWKHQEININTQTSRHEMTNYRTCIKSLGQKRWTQTAVFTHRVMVDDHSVQQGANSVETTYVQTCRDGKDCQTKSTHHKKQWKMIFRKCRGSSELTFLNELWNAAAAAAAARGWIWFPLASNGPNQIGFQNTEPSKRRISIKG